MLEKAPDIGSKVFFEDRECTVRGTDMGEKTALISEGSSVHGWWISFAYLSLPPDPMTRAEQAHYTMRAAYQLVRDDIKRLIATRATFGGNNDRLDAAVAALDSRLDSLDLAPNE